MVSLEGRDSASELNELDRRRDSGTNSEDHYPRKLQDALICAVVGELTSKAKKGTKEGSFDGQLRLLRPSQLLPSHTSEVKRETHAHTANASVMAQSDEDEQASERRREVSSSLNEATEEGKEIE